MTPSLLSSPPDWTKTAQTLLDRIKDTRHPSSLRTPKTQSERLQDYWDDFPTAYCLDQEEAEAMTAADEDMQATNTKGLDTPKHQVNVEICLLCARMAQSFGPKAAAEMAAHRALTVVQTTLDADQALLADIFREAFFPPQQNVTRTLYTTAPEDTVQLVVFPPGQSAKTSSDARLSLKTLEEAMGLPTPILFLLPQDAALPPALADALPKPIPLKPITTETIIFALQNTHSRTGRVDRAQILGLLPDDSALRRLTRPQLLAAFRAPTSIKAAKSLAAAVAGPPARATLQALEGTGDLYKTAQSIVADMQAYADGILPWADIPRGLLLVGPPGTGKTFAATCIAEACGLPFITATFGQWQATGHLGNMLGAMRESFAAATAAAPCLFFIDEIDSAGSRSGTDAQNQSYRQQVINEFLALIDGVGSAEGIMLICATNHVGAIDPAILRAGRLDTHITVPLPGPKALEQQLRHHLGSDWSDRDLSALIKAARGKTPADLAGAIRKARAGARAQKTLLTDGHIIAAMQTATPINAALHWRVAVHEAGHAVVYQALGMGCVQELSIAAGGGQIVAINSASEACLEDYNNHIAYSLAGRSAERLILGQASAGAGGGPDCDLAQATKLALHIERSSGLGLNALLWEPSPPTQSTRAVYPKERAAIHNRLNAQAKRTEALLHQHRSALLALAQALNAASHMTAEEIVPYLEGVRDGPSHPQHKYATPKALSPAPRRPTEPPPLA